MGHFRGYVKQPDGNDVPWGIQVIGLTDEWWRSGAGDNPKGLSMVNSG